jgi:hypothetical protein
MSQLVEKASKLLLNMFDERTALFSYSTCLQRGRYRNDFSHPSIYRYTINSLAGIQRAVKFYPHLWDFGDILERFLAHQLDNIKNQGDNGLLLAVLAEAEHDNVKVQLKKIQKIIENKKVLLGCSLQDLCWILIGLSAYAKKSGSEVGRELSERVFNVLHQHYFNRGTLFPFHSLETYRRRFVSFGAIAYFLKALYEYSYVFSDKYTETIFRRLTSRIIDVQGPCGEWPWFFDAKKGSVVDYYQIYSVHQDSMAMLFLFPALDLGVPGASEAIERSYRWLFGINELKEPIIMSQPFFVFRSIKRKEGWEREKRYARAVLRSITRTKARQTKPYLLEINKECRSYHIGWILYAWSGRGDFREFTELRLL